MPPSFKEFQIHQESLGNQHKPSADIAMGLLRTAAVSFEHLTNDPHWDRYLSILQQRYEEVKQERNRWKELMTLRFSDSDLREAQCAYHKFHAQVELLEYILGLPYEIRNSYSSVKKDKDVPHSKVS